MCHVHFHSVVVELIDKEVMWKTNAAKVSDGPTPTLWLDS